VVESCIPQQAKEYCRFNAQGGPPPRYGGQQWKLVDGQVECMPPFGHYEHLGQWEGDNQTTHHHHMGIVSTKGNGLLATKDNGITIMKGW